GILKHAYTISLKEAANHLSNVKPGVDLGFLPEHTIRFQELVQLIQPAFIKMRLNSLDTAYVSLERAVAEERATLLRKQLGGTIWMLFGRLTERAQKVLAYAQEEAISLKHSNIGTEHLLLGLIKEKEGIAAKVLSSFNISEDNVRDEVFNLINEGDDATASIRYTPRAKKVIELSMDEARKLHHNFV